MFRRAHRIIEKGNLQDWISNKNRCISIFNHHFALSILWDVVAILLECCSFDCLVKIMLLQFLGHRQYLGAHYWRHHLLRGPHSGSKVMSNLIKRKRESTMRWSALDKDWSKSHNRRMGRSFKTKSPLKVIHCV